MRRMVWLTRTSKVFNRVNGTLNEHADELTEVKVPEREAGQGPVEGLVPSSSKITGGYGKGPTEKGGAYLPEAASDHA